MTTDEKLDILIEGLSKPKTDWGKIISLVYGGIATILVVIVFFGDTSDASTMAFNKAVDTRVEYKLNPHTIYDDWVFRNIHGRLEPLEIVVEKMFPEESYLNDAKKHPGYDRTRGGSLTMLAYPLYENFNSIVESQKTEHGY